MADMIYALKMHFKDSDLIVSLDALRRRLGMTQADVAGYLGVRQPHLSKLFARKVPISKKMRPKIVGFLDAGGPTVPKDRELEVELIQAVRSSAAFAELVRVALKMHNLG